MTGVAPGCPSKTFRALMPNGLCKLLAMPENREMAGKRLFLTPQWTVWLRAFLDSPGN